MKAIISTSSAVSTAVSTVCFPPHPPVLRHTICSFPKSHNGFTSITIKPRFQIFRTKAAENGNLEAIKVAASVPVRVAHELLLAGHKYLDVRTQEEFNAGHVPDAVNIPYMFTAGSGMTKNPNFVKEVSSHFRKDDEIIVGCKLGKRSMMAANDLIAAGFIGVTDIAGGYAAWAQNGLPTTL